MYGLSKGNVFVLKLKNIALKFGVGIDKSY